MWSEDSTFSLNLVQNILLYVNVVRIKVRIGSFVKFSELYARLNACVSHDAALRWTVDRCEYPSASVDHPVRNLTHGQASSGTELLLLILAGVRVIRVAM